MTICVAIVVGLSTSARAQEYGFDVWTTANGLPQNTVTGVVQTPDGYLWLSTFDGLARFDGLRFTVFDKGNTRGIINNRFSSIFVDHDGAVWAMTENGVVTVYRNGIFTSHQLPEPFSSTITIVADGNGDAMIETLDGYYHLRDGQFLAAADRKEERVRQLYYGISQAKWTFERNQVSRLKDGQLINYALPLPPESLDLAITLRAYEDRQGALWIPLKDKLCRLANGQVAVFTKKEIPAFDRLIPQVVFEDTEGSLWLVFGTDNLAAQVNGQLVRYQDGHFTSYHLDRPVSATNGFTDREGNFWMATPTGLRRLRRQLISSLSVKNGLNSNEVYPLLQTRKGDILIGSVQGVNRYADGKISDLGLTYTSQAPLYMRGLWEDNRGRVWLGYQGEGGFRRFEARSSARRISKNDLSNGATDFASDREGNIWIATEVGLFKYQDDREIAHYTAQDGLRNDKIITLHFDRNGNLWLGTYDGLTQFKDGSFINYHAEPDCPKGFVRVIYEDADGVLWFGTYGDGLVRYQDGRFFNYRVEHGLFNNGVFAILEDNSGNFWMSSNRGIHRVSKQDLHDFADGKIPKLNSVSYDEKDGMLNAECNGGRIPSAIKAQDGRLWFATMGGVAIVDPEAEKVNQKPPPVIIERVAIDRQPVAAELLQSAIGNLQSAIELAPGQSNIAIEYTGLSLVKSEQIKFRYKLEGLEEEWIEAGTKRTVDYSYLPAGTYTFRLIAANASGIWNREGTAITIIVRPFFYQTRWFIGLLMLALGGLVWWVYHTRVSRLSLIAEAKTAFSRQLIEAQEAERKRIAAELHDGLGQSLVVIKNRAMLGMNKGDDPARVAKELATISESATQALEEVREITNNLRPQLLDRLGLTKAIKAMLKKVAGVIEIHSEIDSIDHLFKENEEISLYRILQEALNNVIKHANATTVAVTIKRTENTVLIKIADNGKGFSVETAKTRGGGLGLIGLQERSQLVNGELRIASEIEQGTVIEVTIQLPK